MHNLLVKVGFRFEDPCDERRFVQSYVLGGRHLTQAAMLLGATVYCAFGLWDWIIDPVAWTRSLAIRVAVAVIVLLPLTAALMLPLARRFAEPLYVPMKSVRRSGLRSPRQRLSKPN